MTGADKPILFIYGNCHSGVLCHYASQLPEITDRFKVVNLLTLPQGPDRPPRTIRDHEIGRGVILWEQVGQWKTFAERDKLAPDCHVVTFPVGDFKSLWPLSCADPACKPIDYDLVGNRFLIERMDLGDPDPLQSYRAANLLDYVDFERLHALTLHRLTLNDAQADVPFGAWILEHMTERRLFWCDRHPTAGTLKELLIQLMACSPLGSPGARRASRARLEQVAQEDLLIRPTIPIEPAFGDALGLRWNLGAAEYGRLEGVFLTPEDYHRDYIQWRRQLLSHS